MPASTKRIRWSAAAHTRMGHVIAIQQTGQLSQQKLFIELKFGNQLLLIKTFQMYPITNARKMRYRQLRAAKGGSPADSTAFQDVAGLNAIKSHDILSQFHLL